MDDRKAVEGLYLKYLKEVRTIFDRATTDFNILHPKNIIQELTTELVNTLQLSNTEIMEFFMRYEQDNYLYSHSVNVTFMSVMVGIWLDYNRSELTHLAMAAILHDIGMVKVSHLALLPKRLGPMERKVIQRHPDYSIEYLSRMPDIADEITDAVRNHHRRPSNSKDISDYSQIIGLVDTFEAMTHPRRYKAAQEPYSVIRTIIEELKGEFSSHIIKAMVDNIGIYPVGTWVRLDTEEIGFVIDVNAGSPLSPKINILLSSDEEKLAEPRTVDLTKCTNIQIRNPLEEEARHRIREVLQQG
jgi:HD-GYP domain-containing protein (c-di-GMP phosphodiesterase class II)